MEALEYRSGDRCCQSGISLSVFSVGLPFLFVAVLFDLTGVRNKTAFRVPDNGLLERRDKGTKRHPSTVQLNVFILNICRVAISRPFRSWACTKDVRFKRFRYYF